MSSFVVICISFENYKLNTSGINKCMFASNNENQKKKENLPKLHTVATVFDRF